MVLKESVDNRLIEQPGPGRPKYDEDEVIDMSPAEYTKFVQDFYDARMRELAAEEDISVVKKQIMCQGSCNSARLLTHLLLRNELRISEKREFARQKTSNKVQLSVSFPVDNGSMGCITHKSRVE